MGNIQVLCRLLSRFEGVARCEIIYWVLQEEISYIDRSATNGTGEDILPVILSISFKFETIISVQANTVGGRQDVTVNGFLFEIGNI